MKLTKAISMFVSIVIGATVAIPIGTTSADDVKSPIEWDGTADTTWYDGEEKEQHISSPSELAGLAVLTGQGRKMEGQTIILDNDISLKHYQWQSIKNFYGKFDGNDHTIYGMNIVSTSDTPSTQNNFGLFGMASEATIQNLNLKDISIDIEKESTNFSIGGLAGFGGTIIDSSVSGSIKCKNTASSSFNVGGIAGASHTIIRCKSNVTINVYSVEDSDIRIGGICGSMDEGEIAECCNYGQIIHDGSAQYHGIAGIIGLLAVHSQTSYIKNCYNRADIESSLDSYGIVGRLSFFDLKNHNYEISNVYNTGNCTYGAYKSYDYEGKYSNVYYSSISASKGTDGKNDLSTPKPVDNMKKEAFATSLGSSFVYIENELPILKWEAKDMPISTATSTTTTTTSELTSTTTTTTTTATTSTLTSTTTTSKTNMIFQFSE